MHIAITGLNPHDLLNKSCWMLVPRLCKSSNTLFYMAPQSHRFNFSFTYKIYLHSVIIIKPQLKNNYKMLFNFIIINYKILYK